MKSLEVQNESVNETQNNTAVCILEISRLELLEQSLPMSEEEPLHAELSGWTHSRLASEKSASFCGNMNISI